MPFFIALERKMSANELLTTRPESEIRQRPGCMFPRGPAPEVAAGDEDCRARASGLFRGKPSRFLKV